VDINDQLSWITDSLSLLIPEGWLCLGIVALLVGSFFKRTSKTVFFGFTLGVLLIVLMLLVIHWPASPILLFGGSMRTDDFSYFFKILIGTGGLLTLAIDNRQDRSAEYYLLILSVVVGGHFLVMSLDMVMVVLSLELISIPSYILATGLTLDKKNAEAGWKYFLFGSAATAVMVFGMSYLFGLAGTLQFASSIFVERLLAQQTPLLLLGGLMTLGGFLFKVASVPFHLWAPDVYEATPTPTVAFFSVTPKLAGLAVLTKFVLALNLFGQSNIDWSSIVGVLALASIVLGTVAALTQTNAKRMMAYSSIAQTGFLMAAIATLTPEGVHMAMFYSCVLLVMNFLTFHVLVVGEESLGNNQMQTFAGWGRVGVVPSVGIVVGLISLTGLPPTGGFMAKLFVFSSLWGRFSMSGDQVFLWLFAIGLLATVASLFYYLKIPYYLFLKQPTKTFTDQKISFRANLLTILLVIVLLYLFFQPALLMGWVNKVNFVL
jgi:NADH-quinone oxidoreductase subunit N